MTTDLLHTSNFYICMACWYGMYTLAYVTSLICTFSPRVLRESKNPFKSNDFKYIWNFCTHGLATMHAISIVIMASNLISKYGLQEIWNYNFHINHPEAVNKFSQMNAFMMSYLITDVLYHIFELIFDNDSEKKLSRLLTIIHHSTGAVSMYFFIITRQVHFNSLYFSMTEISTIPLHATWAILTLGLKDDPEFKSIFLVLGAITWILFLSVRIIGSIFLWTYVVLNIEAVSYTHLDVYKRQIQIIAVVFSIGLSTSKSSSFGGPGVANGPS